MTLFSDERDIPDNGPRANFVFMGYPFNPPLPRDDYARVVAELQEELPVRFWYFLDEVTTDEMVRKIWRAVLRADLAVFDITGGNPNVAFELGLAVAINKRCMTVLKTGEANPLGTADLGYAERIEYTSAGTLKDKLRSFSSAQCTALRTLSQISYDLHPSAENMAREDLYDRIVRIVGRVFRSKHITKGQASRITGDDQLASAILQGLRRKEVLQVEGERRGARWVFTDKWSYHDHDVSGIT